ncbi:hypothetical protein OG21DRAFT_1482659 [Imleria badia]|nr:hypothetical protein OG21DRAFT_1482659 [Imleria badia]
MYPTPLPPDPFPDNPLQTAYQRCLALEVAAQAGLKPNSSCPPPLVCARLLGHLLRLAPNTNGREQVQREIMSAADDDQLMEVASVYLNGFIRVFKRSEPTPAPSEHSSRSSMDDDARAVEMETETERILEGQLDYTQG